MLLIDELVTRKGRWSNTKEKLRQWVVECMTDDCKYSELARMIHACILKWRLFVFLRKQMDGCTFE